MLPSTLLRLATPRPATEDSLECHRRQSQLIDDAGDDDAGEDAAVNDTAMIDLTMIDLAVDIAEAGVVVRTTLSQPALLDRSLRSFQTSASAKSTTS